MDATEWQLHVSGKLGSIERGLLDLVEQVNKQNGNVAELWRHMSEVERHPQLCPIGDEVSALREVVEAHHAASAARKAESAAWQRKLQPAAWLIAVFFVGLVLGHSELLKGLLK